MHRARCSLVGLGLTAAAGGLVHLLGRAALAPAPQTAGDAVVRLCLGLLLLSTVGVWCSSIAAVAEAWRGAGPAHTPSRSVVRRLVLAACGVAVGAALLAPSAQAAQTRPPADRIAGLPMPERATDGPHRSRTAPAELIVVHAGDTLWRLAAARLPRDASDSDVDAAWRRLYAANRALIGADPDLVHPGLRLTDPGPSTQEKR